MVSSKNHFPNHFQEYCFFSSLWVQIRWRNIFRRVYFPSPHLQGSLHSSLPLLDSTGGPHLCLSLFLTFPLFLLQVHVMDWKCLQILLFLQSNSSFIFSISEIPRKEFPCGPIAVLLPCYLYVRKTVKSVPMLPILGPLSPKDVVGGPPSFLRDERHAQAVYCQRHSYRSPRMTCSLKSKTRCISGWHT